MKEHAPFELSPPIPPVPGRSPHDPGLAAVLDELAHGVVVVTVTGRLLHANHAGRHELGRQRLLDLQGGHVHARWDGGERQLHAALARAQEGKRGLLTLSHGGATLTAAVLPIKACETSNEPARAVLMFARAMVCDPLMLCFFARSHGLTATEEQVLGILCQGYSAPQAARQLQVAVSTVRSHVRSLCSKTRCNGVRELVNRVAVLPPLVTAFLQYSVH